MNNYEWAADMLAAASLPTTPNNVANVARWMVAEEPVGDWWHNNNPLNVNAGGSGSDTFPNLTAAGLKTASVVRQSNMAGIFRALAASAPLATFSAAVVASPWASSHYGGNPQHIAQIPAPPAVNMPGSPATPNGGTLVPMGKPAVVAIMELPGSDTDYWLVAEDGGVFTFGKNAGFYGSMGGKALSAPIVDGVAMSDGKGYALVGADGAVYNFGSSDYEGGTNK